MKPVTPDPKTPLRRVVASSRRFFDRLIRCRGDKVRYLRYLGARIGEGCAILNNVADFGSEPWLVEIGNRVTLTAGVQLVTHDGSSRLFRDEISGGCRYGNVFGPIAVRDNSFVGVNAVLLPGISVGPNSIVAAGSVVTHDVPPNTVVAGVPARHRFSLEEYVERYKAKMVHIESDDRRSLRRELTLRFWGEER